MTFATPLIAAIAAGIAIPALLILYFLKLRRRDLEISSTLLWKKAIQDLQANAPFQKLRNNILLILQLIALAAGLFALAQPEFKNQGKQSQRQIILIDRSASMSATDGDYKAPLPGSAPGAATPASSSSLTRFEAAKKRALDIVSNLREPSFISFDDKPEEAMVIAFDSNAEVRQTFTSSKALLQAAIESITPTDAPTSLVRAFDLAKAYTGTKKFEDQVVESKDGKPAGFVPQSPGATIHLISDGRLPDADKIQTGADDIVYYHAVGSPDAINIGITGLRAERAFDNPARVNLFVGLQSTDTQPRSVDVELSIDGQLSDVKDVKVAPAQRAIGADAARDDMTSDQTTPPTPEAKTGVTPGQGGFVLPLERPLGGIATVHINPKGGQDALDRDNTAYVVIPPAKRLSVVLVTSGNFYLASALEGMKLSHFDIKTPAEFQKILDSGAAGQYDVFVFDRALPTVKGADGKKSPTLPRGRSLVLGAVPPPPLGAIDGGEGPADLFVDYSRDHPALRLASLDKINVAKTRKVTLAKDTPVRAIARTKDGPAILEVIDPSSQAIIVAFDPSDSDWPFEPGYVLFLASSVLYLSETQSGSAGDSVMVGQTLETRLPPGSTDVRVELPRDAGGESVRLEPAPDGTVSYGPIQKIGIYRVSWTGNPPVATARDTAEGSRVTRAISANLLDPSESDLGTRPTLAMAREVVKATADHETTLTRRLWPWLLLAALAVVMFEWFIYNRKVAI